MKLYNPSLDILRMIIKSVLLHKFLRIFRMSSVSHYLWVVRPIQWKSLARNNICMKDEKVIGDWTQLYNEKFHIDF
jgi:hypothetical protein